MITAEEPVLEDRPELIFSPLVVRAGLALYAAVVIGLVWSYLARRTALLEPVDPQVRAVATSLAVFAGVLFAAVIRDGWTLGFNLFRPVPKGFLAAVQLTALVGAAYVAGGHLAEMWTEWRAFHGLQPPTRVAAFRVVQHRRARRTSEGLDLSDASGSTRFSIGCGLAGCPGVPAGSWIEIQVQTGRGGLRRAVLPIRPRDHLLHG